MTALRIEKRAVTEPVTVIDLPFPISVNEMFGQAPGQKRFPSSRYASWKTEATYRLRSQRPQRFVGRVQITITLEDRTNGDADNLCKGVLDLLVREKIIQDDRRQILRRLTVEWGNVTGARVEIRGAA